MTHDPMDEIADAYAEAEMRVALLRETLIEARAELALWGWGDHHYGSTPQEPQVVAMIAKIDETLSATKEAGA